MHVLKGWRPEKVSEMTFFVEFLLRIFEQIEKADALNRLPFGVCVRHPQEKCGPNFRLSSSLGMGRGVWGAFGMTWAAFGMTWSARWDNLGCLWNDLECLWDDLESLWNEFGRLWDSIICSAVGKKHKLLKFANMSNSSLI